MTAAPVDAYPGVREVAAGDVQHQSVPDQARAVGDRAYAPAWDPVRLLRNDPALDPDHFLIRDDEDGGPPGLALRAFYPGDDGLFSDETALASTDFKVWPPNALLGPEQNPYTALWITPWGDEGTWPDGLWVEIDAQWGWPAIPQAIIQATIHITAVLRLETAWATQSLQTEFSAAIQASPEAQTLLARLAGPYRRNSFA